MGNSFYSTEHRSNRCGDMSSGRKKAARQSVGSLTLPSHVYVGLIRIPISHQRARCLREFVILWHTYILRYISGMCSSTSRRLAFPVREIANFYDARSYAPSTRRTRGFNADKNSSERICFLHETYCRGVASWDRDPNLGHRIVTIYSVLQVLQRSSLDDFSLSRTAATFDNIWRKDCSFFRSLWRRYF